MFFAVSWLVVSLAGGVLAGSLAIATTRLTASINSTANSIPVRSTTGFPSTGVLLIKDESIAYSSKTATAFNGNLAKPLVRGSQDTEAVAHLVGSLVRTAESSMMNQSAQYNTSVIVDASGIQAVIQIPLAVLRLAGSYLQPPMGFLGSDLQILLYLWWAMMAGMIISIGVALAGTWRG